MEKKIAMSSKILEDKYYADEIDTVPYCNTDYQTLIHREDNPLQIYRN
jgi:hypothetical protein